LKTIEKYKAFKKSFDSREGKVVKDDLAQFCLYNSTTIAFADTTIDPYRMMMQEGRRQVYLYILANLVEPKEKTEGDKEYPTE
jgi:hypothetical protein